MNCFCFFSANRQSDRLFLFFFLFLAVLGSPISCCCLCDKERQRKSKITIITIIFHSKPKTKTNWNPIYRHLEFYFIFPTRLTAWLNGFREWESVNWCVSDWNRYATACMDGYWLNECDVIGWTEHGFVPVPFFLAHPHSLTHSLSLSQQQFALMGICRLLLTPKFTVCQSANCGSDAAIIIMRNERHAHANRSMETLISD